QEGYQAKRRLLLKEGMQPLLLLALLPGGKHGLAAVLGKPDGAAVSSLKIAGTKLTPVEKRQREPVSQNGPQLLHQVERQARPSGPVAVEEADGRIESHAFGRAATVVGEQGVEEGQHGIDRVERRPARAAAEGDFRVRRANHVAEDTK